MDVHGRGRFCHRSVPDGAQPLVSPLYGRHLAAFDEGQYDAVCDRLVNRAARFNHYLTEQGRFQGSMAELTATAVCVTAAEATEEFSFLIHNKQRKTQIGDVVTDHSVAYGSRDHHLARTREWTIYTGRKRLWSLSILSLKKIRKKCKMLKGMNYHNNKKSF